MVALAQLSLPVLVIAAFILFKLNHEHKRWLFRCPIWISSTALSFLIAHSAGGVMGFYAAIFCDLLLYPTMLLIKKLWLRQEANKTKKGEFGSIAQPLPAH